MRFPVFEETGDHTLGPKRLDFFLGQKISWRQVSTVRHFTEGEASTTKYMHSCPSPLHRLCHLRIAQTLCLKIPDGPLSLGRFEIAPSGGLVQPGQNVCVTVWYSPENANAHRESLCIKVRVCKEGGQSITPPSLQGVVVGSN